MILIVELETFIEKKIILSFLIQYSQAYENMTDNLMKGGKNMSNDLRNESQPKWLDPKDLKKKCGFSTDRQATLRSEGKIPFYRIGRYIRYSSSEIDEWILSHRVV